jgi:SAM-dependent methyltransferase
MRAAKVTNLDERTVRSFGEEWSTYDQSHLVKEDRIARRFEEYFAIFPWDALPEGAAGADIGCGSGRWAAIVGPRVGVLHCVDASDRALAVARRNLASCLNCLCNAKYLLWAFPAPARRPWRRRWRQS